MSCEELFKRAVEALERDVYDWEAMDELVYRCGEPFAGRIIDAAARRLAQYSMSVAWRHYRGAVLAGRHPADAYAEAVYMVWRPWDGRPRPAGFLPASPPIWPRPRLNTAGRRGGPSWLCSQPRLKRRIARRQTQLLST